MPRGTLDPGCSEQISCTGVSPCFAGLPRPFHYPFFHVMPVQTPKILRPSVWPLPRSLATTSGISVDVFSSPYLDVSVQAVPRVHLFDSMHADRVLLCRVSPFGNLRINAYLQLPEAFRSLSRPSSAPDAKAFPLRSFQLDLRQRKRAPLRSRTLAARLFAGSVSLPPSSSPNKSRFRLVLFGGRETALSLNGLLY